MIYKLKGTLTSAMFVVLTLLIISFLILTPVFSAIILGAVFAYGIRPISKRMLPYLKFETISILISMVIVILPLIVLIIIIINSLIESTPLVVGIVKSANISSINTTTIQQYPLVQQYMPVTLQTYIGSFLNAINVGIETILRNFLDYLIGKLGSIPALLFELFIFFASTFYIAKDGDKLWEYITYTIPEDRTHYFDTLFKEIKRVLKSIFVGHFLTSIITGVLAGIGFAIIGYPFASFLGILTGFFQLIPFIGHWPIPTVLAIYGFLTGSYIKAIAVISLSLALSGLDLYLRPKLSSRYADIHPLIFILGFLCGPLVFGLVGFVLGPLILGVTYAAVISFKKERTDVNTKTGQKEDEKTPMS